jgi:hypothetical protein
MEILVKNYRPISMVYYRLEKKGIYIDGNIAEI